jgi:hypothetical protein
MIETPPSTDRPLRLPRMTRAQAILLRAFCLWTVWIWATRIWNIWGDDARGTGFKVVHTVLAAVSIAFAVAAWLVVRRLRTPVPVADTVADHAVDAG